VSEKRKAHISEIEAVLANANTGLMERQAPEVRDELEKALKEAEQAKQAPKGPAAKKPSRAPKAKPDLDEAAAEREQRIMATDTTSDEFIEEDEEPNAALAAVREFLRTWRRVTKKGTDRLETVSIPGGVWLPFSILMLLFIVLLPVNGHTRLGWLWKTITGNARIGPPLPSPTILTPVAGTAAETGASVAGPGTTPGASGSPPPAKSSAPGPASSKAPPVAAPAHPPAGVGTRAPAAGASPHKGSPAYMAAQALLGEI
jgi:hypothetical protein